MYPQKGAAHARVRMVMCREFPSLYASPPTGQYYCCVLPSNPRFSKVPVKSARRLHCTDTVCGIGQEDLLKISEGAEIDCMTHTYTTYKLVFTPKDTSAS